MRLRHAYMRICVCTFSLHSMLSDACLFLDLGGFLIDINMRICAYVYMRMNIGSRRGFDLRLFRVMVVRFCKV